MTSTKIARAPVTRSTCNFGTCHFLWGGVMTSTKTTRAPAYWNTCSLGADHPMRIGRVASTNVASVPACRNICNISTWAKNMTRVMTSTKDASLHV